MDFNDYQIPKEYTSKFKFTQRDKKQFKKFWNDELVKLNKMNDLPSTTIELLHKSLMDCFWMAKALAKEKYTPTKYKKTIYANNA